MTALSTRRKPINEEYSIEYNQPAFWSILDNSDQQKYKKLRDEISILAKQNRNKETPQLFQKELNMIKAFCVQGDEKDYERMVVCGIIFHFPSVIAIHIQQLKILMSKCKSSINNFLKKLGYKTIQQGLTQDISCKSAILQSPCESKKWTIRELESPIYFDDQIKLDKIEEDDELFTLNVGTDSKDPGESYPCPIKYREKIYDTIYSSKSIQTSFDGDTTNIYNDFYWPYM